MSIKNFITDMLNVNPVDIESISTVVQSDNTVKVKIRLKSDPAIKCPFCKQPVIKNGFISRTLTHSTLVNRKCIIVYDRRRYLCKSCGLSFCEDNPFINTRESVTLETKINVLKDLKKVANTYTSIAERYNLSVTKIQRIFDKSVNIKRKTLPEVLSIDEHYFPASNFDSLYICILMDFKTGVIVDVLPDRKKAYISQYLNNIRNATLDLHNKSELDNVKYVSIDLYENYRDLSHIYFPYAKVCADSFHVLEHLTKDFHMVRLRCRRNTQDENIQYLLTKFKSIFNHDTYLDNTPKYNKRFKRYLNYRDILTILFDYFPELKKAYDLKETYIQFNNTASYDTARTTLTDIIKSFADSNIKEYDEFYNMLINWYEEIINSFIIINGRRINNSYIESRNNQIERLIYNARGFVNFKRTRNRILYCLNKKDTYKI